MSTELDKQAREFIDDYSYELRIRDGSHKNQIAKFAAAFASQVREQSKWVSVASGELPAFKERVLAFDGTRILVDYLMDVTNKRWHSGWNMTHWASLPAPPETTEQESKNELD